VGMWQCIVCGYIYDSNIGDPDNGVEAHVAFESLPSDWCCPDCGAEKELFAPSEEGIDSNVDKDLFAHYADDTEEDY
jgi:rubredoxin